MYYLLFFEFIGTSELLVVLVVALIIFGPRKLPELGRTLGQAMHQFKNATDDFKRTWETEALLETSGGGVLAPAVFTEHVAAAEAYQELVPADAIEVKALTVGEPHESLHEATADGGVPRAVHGAALGEG